MYRPSAPEEEDEEGEGVGGHFQQARDQVVDVQVARQQRTRVQNQAAAYI